jgi:hypothetical protein
MAVKKLLIDRYLRSRLHPTGKRIEVWGGLVPGFGIRITDE